MPLKTLPSFVESKKSCVRQVGDTSTFDLKDVGLKAGRAYNGERVCILPQNVGMYKM